eukprot:TRINITY_DN1818_c0_g1_i2.p1 TRINITY_DN1818_c0_g1~~TRINITY_DN1818_c0_g1_i2.p1  ORF type:complete len:297 (+),score=79.69 TRINITY_DN1818_c0_g1_i2:108-893(+)
MLRSLVGSEMCIRDRYQRRVRGAGGTMAAYKPIAVPSATGAARQMFVRRHRDNDGNTKANTIFIANIPPGCSTSKLRAAFEQIGAVEDLKLFAVGGGGPAHVAHVTFREADALDRFLELDEFPSAVCDKFVAPSLEEWVAEHQAKNNVSLVDLQSEVDDFMDSYEIKEADQADAWARARGKLDDDGFITVANRGNSKKKLKGEGGSKRKRSKKKELTDFYIWQTRETKRQRIADLRHSFEEDKKRIAKLKAARKFKPFGFE